MRLKEPLFAHLFNHLIAVGKVIRHQGHLPSRLQGSVEVPCKRSLDESMLGVALLRPRVGEVDVGGSDRLRVKVVAGQEASVATDNEEVLQPAIFPLGPDLLNPTELELDGDPVRFGLSFRSVDDPVAVATAKFNRDRSLVAKE